jgi:hypothetical protein
MHIHISQAARVKRIGRIMNLKLLVSLPLVCCSVFSQGPTVPPPIVRIVSTPGVSGRPGRSLGCPKAAVEILGLAAATGAPQTWTLEMHPTFGSIEDLDQAVNATPLAGLTNDSRAMIAVLQLGWSYRPDDAVRALPKARYIRVTIHRIRPGAEADFGGLARLHKMTSDRFNSGQPDMFYHVVSGDDSGTYIVLSPLASLRVLDEGPADAPADAAAEAKAADIENSREHYLFRVDPGLSCVSEGFAAGDPGFWHP